MKAVGDRVFKEGVLEFLKEGPDAHLCTQGFNRVKLAANFIRGRGL